jgi:hypothetical protein
VLTPPNTRDGFVSVRGAEEHNLRDVDVDAPRDALTVFTGVPDSGRCRGWSPSTEKPIGRTSRSNLATYAGMFDAVRKLFAATDAARERGWGPGRFSFNVAGGRCETCQGEGFVAVEVLFLPGTYGPCPTCGGARYNPETLAVTYREHTIADVLRLTVDEAAAFLDDVPAAARRLGTLRDVGLGYLRLGQPGTELSGGEAQRIKLATELQSQSSGQRRRMAPTGPQFVTRGQVRTKAQVDVRGWPLSAEPRPDRLPPSRRCAIRRRVGRPVERGRGHQTREPGDVSSRGRRSPDGRCRTASPP